MLEREAKLLENIQKIPLTFGGAAISGEGGGYGFGSISEKEAISLLEEAKDHGIKIFDSAPIYGFGLSEKRIGEAFKKQRDEVFLCSKSGVTWSSSKRVDMTNDPKVAQKMLEQSLRDFQSDYIDLYMVHWPDSRIDIRRPLEILAKAKEQGKIKHIGLCNTSIEDIEKAKEIERIEVVQAEYNLFEDTLKKEFFPYLDQSGISFMSWGTLDKGILTGRVHETRTFEKCDARSWAPWWDKKGNLVKINKMKKVWSYLEENGHTGLELALGHNLSSPEMSTAICGMRNSKQLLEALKALKNLPSLEVLETVKKIIET
jgi:aryl-alcohol dehydrogenase-like predicted oxidoreductase